MKNKLLYGFQFFLILVILASIFVGLLVISALIPSNLLKDNIIDSLDILNKEGYYPIIKNNFLLDNYTDALMLNTAYSIDYKEPLKSVILNRRNYVAHRNDIVLKDLGNNNENTIQNLEDTLNEKNTEYYEYSRYWHGYLVYLRPLLLIGDYSLVRLIFLIIIIALSLYTIFLVYKKINLYFAVIFTYTLLSISIYYMGLSMQYSSIFIITLLSSIYILYKNANIKDVNKLFYIIGATTCFMDLFTSPMISFGIPLILYLLLDGKQEGKDIKEVIKKIVKLAVFWVIGYGGIWLLKWIVSDSLFNTGTITNSFNQVLVRSSKANYIDVTIFDTIIKNVIYVKPYLIISFMVALISFGIIVITYKNNNKFIIKEMIRMNIPYILIGTMPFIWYIIVKNHSYIHAWFTFKNLCITIFCLLIISINNLSIYKKNKIKENTR